MGDKVQKTIEPTMDGVKAKFARAQQHAQDVDVAYSAWRAAMVNDPPVGVDMKISPDGQPTFVVTAIPANPNLTLMIGDCIHNLRACLDHLVVQLALQEGHDVKSYSTLAFPIYTDKSTYDKAVRRKIVPYIKNTNVLTAIESIQPYHYPDPKKSPLWVLSELDNIDKHRINIIINPKLVKRDVIEDRGPVTDEKYESTSEDTDLMIYQIEVWPTSHATAQEAGTTAINITLYADAKLIFADTGLACDGWTVRKVLEVLLGHVQYLLQEFEKRFF